MHIAIYEKYVDYMFPLGIATIPDIKIIRCG